MCNRKGIPLVCFWGVQIWKTIYVQYAIFFFNVYNKSYKNKVLLCIRKSLHGITTCISVHLIRLALRKNSFGSLGRIINN